jgi:hypothetical protein
VGFSLKPKSKSHMKTFIISSSDLDTAFSKLCELSHNTACYFTTDTYNNKIEVFNDNDELVATIQIADVIEPYELVKDLLNLM